MPTEPVVPAPPAIKCIPDRYLTQEHLEMLLEDFKASISASLPIDSVFYHLVNGVRQAYIPKLLNQQPSPQPERFQGCISEPPSPGSVVTSHRVPQIPAETTVLHVGALTSPRRDMTHWDYWDTGSWARRFSIKVFQLQEVGTIRITVGHRLAPDRMWVYSGGEPLPAGWAWRMDFYVFGEERKGTEMISVGKAKDCDPDRCIFVRGDHVDKLEGWEERFVFWVPI